MAEVLRFLERLHRSWRQADSLVCVGLDPDLGKLPAALSSAEDPILAFNRAIIEATADLVCAYKPQAAYYHAAAAESALAQTIAYIRERAPHAFIILDAKRGDIGTTAEQYAREAFMRYGADAVTVNPYLGGDTLEPFLRNPATGAFILCRTSNPGAGELQDLVLVEGKKLYQLVAEKCTGPWNRHGNVGLVAGATCPEELGEIRRRAVGLPLLVPGIGAQGGDLEGVLREGLDEHGEGLLINSSRAILYASAGSDFAQAARRVTQQLRDDIRRYRDRQR